MTEPLRDSQIEFYERNYGIYVGLIELAYQELVSACDQEGISYLKKRLSEIAKEARARCREVNSDIFHSG